MRASYFLFFFVAFSLSATYELRKIVEPIDLDCQYASLQVFCLSDGLSLCVEWPCDQVPPSYHNVSFEDQKEMKTRYEKRRSALPSRSRKNRDEIVWEKAAAACYSFLVTTMYSKVLEFQRWSGIPVKGISLTKKDLFALLGCLSCPCVAAEDKVTLTFPQAKRLSVRLIDTSLEQEGCTEQKIFLKVKEKFLNPTLEPREEEIPFSDTFLRYLSSQLTSNYTQWSEQNLLKVLKEGIVYHILPEYQEIYPIIPLNFKFVYTSAALTNLCDALLSYEEE